MLNYQISTPPGEPREFGEISASFHVNSANFAWWDNVCYMQIQYNMGFGSETMMCKQFYAYDCDMNTYNHTFSEEYLLHVSYIPFLQGWMSKIKIFTSISCVLFFYNISTAICFWINLLFSRLYLKNARIPCTKLFKRTCAHWVHIFFNYNLERCNIIYKHIVVILKLWPPLHGTLRDTILFLHCISWTFTHQAGETWLGELLLP